MGKLKLRMKTLKDRRSPPLSHISKRRENGPEGQSIGGESALPKSCLKTKEGAYLASFTEEAEAGGSLEPRCLETAQAD